VIAREGWTTVPEDQVEGFIPTYDAAAFAVSNLQASPRKARTVGAVIGPIPGTEPSRGSSPYRAAARADAAAARVQVALTLAAVAHVMGREPSGYSRQTAAADPPDGSRVERCHRGWPLG